MLARRDKLLMASALALLAHALVLVHRDSARPTGESVVAAGPATAAAEPVMVVWPPLPPAGALAPGMGGTSRTSTSDAYVDRVQRHLARYADVLPASASGVARVRFTVAPDGSVTDVVLALASGNTALDAIALALPTQAAPLPQPGLTALRLEVPIRSEPGS